MPLLHIPTTSDHIHPTTASMDTICTKLETIVDHMQKLVDHTNPEPLTHTSLEIAQESLSKASDSLMIAIIGILIAVIAGFFTWLGAKYSKGSMENTKLTADHVQRVASETQIKLLEDLVRHLYRNQICTHAMLAKIKKSNYKEFPSEAHFLKLKTLAEDIHLENYNSKPEYYAKMHELSLLLRNYNVEVEVIQRYFCSENISTDMKIKGGESLVFKPFFLISRISEVMEMIQQDLNKNNPEKNQQEKAIEIVLTEHFDKITDNINSKEIQTAYNLVFANKHIQEIKEEISFLEKETRKTAKKVDSVKKNQIEIKKKTIKELEELKMCYKEMEDLINSDSEKDRALRKLTLRSEKEKGEDEIKDFDLEKRVKEWESERESEKHQEEINKPEEFIVVNLKNTFSTKFAKGFEKSVKLKDYIYQQLYKEDYEIRYDNENRTKENNKIKMEWNAYDLINKALIRDAVMEYYRINMIHQPRKGLFGNIKK